MFKVICVLMGVAVGMVVVLLTSPIESSEIQDCLPRDPYSMESSTCPPGFGIAILDSFIVNEMNNRHIPGVSACAIKDGEVIWTGSYGWANIEDSIEMTDTTVFYLASVSKTVTAIALMQLWEDGLFGLDDSINAYLPFDVIHPWYPDSVITFRMLLTHLSGIRDDWRVLNPLWVAGGDSPIPIGEFMEDYLTPGGAYYLTSNFIGMPPGTLWDYCNVATGLIGYLVEVISDTSFPEYCQENIFTPLEMYETAWHLADLDTGNVAMGYRWNAPGASYTPTAYHHGIPLYPCVTCRSSTPQLARYLIAFMQYGEIEGVRILDSTTVELMTTVEYSISPIYEQGLMWYTYYWGDQWAWEHAGGHNGFSTVIAMDTARNSGSVVLTNGHPGHAEAGVLAIEHKLLEFAGGYPYACGDCNGDGQITFGDALYMKNYYYQTPPGSPAPIGNGDVNVDGQITFGDALYIKNYYYQTPPGSPAPCEPPKAAPLKERRMER